MTFHLAVNDLKQLRSYLAADSYFQQTKKIRGKSDDYRPLRHSRRDHRYKQLRKIEVAGERPIYAARLYNTDLIEYHPDHLIINTTTHWTSQSTVAFLNAVLPDWVQVAVHKDRFWARINYGVWFVPDPTRKLKIMVDAINNYKPVGQHVQAGKVEMQRVDRKAANQKYKPLKDYFQWAHCMFEMGAAEQMVAIELDFPVNAQDHEMTETGGFKKNFWECERNYVSDGVRKLQELVSVDAVNPDNFPKLLTLSLGIARHLRTTWRQTDKLFYVDTTFKTHKAWMQKFIVKEAEAYVWEHRPNDTHFPSQTIRVNVSEPIRIGD